MGSIVDDLAAKVAAYTTIEASVEALLTDLSTRLKQAVQAGDLTQISTLIAQIDGNNAKLQAAVVANTVQAAPAPAPVTPAPAPSPTGDTTSSTGGTGSTGGSSTPAASPAS